MATQTELEKLDARFEAFEEEFQVLLDKHKADFMQTYDGGIITFTDAPDSVAQEYYL